MNGLGGGEGVLRGALSFSSPGVTATTTTTTGGSITVLYSTHAFIPSHPMRGRRGGMAGNNCSHGLPCSYRSVKRERERRE